MPSPFHVLIIDDMPDTRTLLRVILTRRGEYTVSEAASGEAGLRMAQDSPPDLIILDYMMPGMDGAEVCRQLRAMPQTRQTPILVLTARVDRPTRDKMLALGVNSYLHKPIHPRQLRSAVESLLTNHRETASGSQT